MDGDRQCTARWRSQRIGSGMDFRPCIIYGLLYTVLSLSRRYFFSTYFRHITCPACSMVQYELKAVLAMNAKEYFVERDTAAFRALLAEATNLAELELVGVTVDEETGAEVAEL